MKFLCLFAGALLAAAIVEAYTRDIENVRPTEQWNQHNNGRLNFNDKNWYNQGRNQKYNVDHQFYGEHNKQYGQVSYEKHQQHSGLTSDVSSGSISSESNSQEEYLQIARNNQNDAAYIVGNISAKKMVRFYSIVEKYINSNGQIQNRWSNEPVELQQVTVPLPNHQFLNMNENKINGLHQGTIKSIKLNTENNYVDVDYHFDDLLVNGNLKTNNGQRERFQVKMLNTDVTVSTELYNKNLKTVDTFNEKLEMSMENSSLLEREQILNENTEALYLRYWKRTIENQMVENTYNGLIGCMRHEALKEIFFPMESTKNMEIFNKKSGLKVTLAETQNWRDLASNNANKISSVAVRPIKTGNGFRIKANIVLAKQPSWESDINVQKGEQQTTFRNVQFQANEIVATATMEGINQLLGGRHFNVVDVDVKFYGLRFDLPNDQTFATELEQNLRHMMENYMAVVLKEQLKHEYQIYQQVPEQYNQCVSFNH
ncbi:uncharacterized protein LOC126897055 [Daktulosphaira vitifoliae]|uniref:uncharacterized protein LOC126897054 n=1 Tax=Daktulosphaira vitifoliae TaxID=58002 RepID=UPI0021A981FA|nr:uncharacterized protein LOC126897054 [Daktulosphaira vitifoliae]XP_050526392.1 uncharacterized protein LOC126897055 [Daktulosphaira vitifoliae]